ncbi:MAG: hypothetical protein JW753_00755 [Dehalococcoidia bacterium]|nr:hypothetical protein [Dehalococcoidia bacterium]
MTDTSQVTVLDHVEGIQVNGDPFSEPANEYAALLALREGLRFLYSFAVDCDRIVLARLNPKERVFMTGNSPTFAGVPLRLLTCAFHWYSISACQYVRTVGTIARRESSSRPLPPHYVKSVIPEVLAFRDKVAAHYAWSTKHGQDNEAERLASIMPPVGFRDDSFHVGVLTVTMRSSGVPSNSSVLKPWSIAKTHQCLRKRYWPEEADSQ